MKRIVQLSVVLACICSWSVLAALAVDPATTGSKSGCSKDKAKSASCMATCNGSPSGFPAMVMTVNGKKFDCCIAAGKAAKEADTKVVYMIGEQKFECPDAAMVALADASEQFVDRYLSIACVADGKVMYCKDSAACCSGHTAMAKSEGGACPHAAKGSADVSSASHGGEKTIAAKSEGGCSHGATAMAKSEGKSEAGCAHGATAMAKADGCCHGGSAVAMSGKDIEACCKNAKEVKYMVCGRTFKSRDEAATAREKTVEALTTVKMTYVVDGKDVDCASKVCPVAKKEGKVVYVVGTEKMKCEFQARVALAKAKYETARDTAEKLAKL